MLHAWIWTPNPDGMFAADNWSIPYIRAGLIPPDHNPRAAALAISLLTGGVDYFTATVDAIASPVGKQHKAVDTAFARARSAVEQSVSQHETRGLSDIWRALMHSLESAIEAKKWNELRAVLPLD